MTRQLLSAIAFAGALGAGSLTASAQDAPSDLCTARSFDVYFETEGDALNAEAQRALSGLQSALEGCRIDRVRVVGMSGGFGDVNDPALAERRAQAVAAALEAGGWSPARFELVADSGAASPRQPMRRRVHIMVEASAPFAPDTLMAAHTPSV